METVLMVCLGNICRSPLAEGILRDKAEKLNLSITIDSAGTSNYHIGEHPDKRTIANANKHGIDVSQLKARQFTVADFDKFDAIFVMDSSNYSDVISLARDEADKMKVEMILNRVYPNSNMAVPDPYFGGEQGFENVFILLEQACEVIAKAIQIKLQQGV
ncbi:MAG: low molecular weight protein-tyrosine-phosphatase [Bacteroidia bacterium]|jgi:protein-tyrosine phosphatase